jgi:hypothetical protein
MRCQIADKIIRITAVRVEHATQQSCSPGYRQQIALRAGHREVLLAPPPAAAAMSEGPVSLTWCCLVCLFVLFVLLFVCVCLSG